MCQKVEIGQGDHRVTALMAETSDEQRVRKFFKGWNTRTVMGAKKIKERCCSCALSGEQDIDMNRLGSEGSVRRCSCDRVTTYT